MSTATRPPLTDSPWFWLYVFATAGVLSLVLIGPKFGARQSQLDRQFEGRRHITQLPADVPGQRPYSSAVVREQSLRPLYVILTVAVLGGWLLLWWQRYSSRPMVPVGDLQAVASAVASEVASAESAGEERDAVGEREQGGASGGAAFAPREPA